MSHLARGIARVAISALLGFCVLPPVAAQPPAEPYGGVYPPPSEAQIREALRLGEQFQAQMPSHRPRVTTPFQAIPPAYLRVEPPPYCQRYPYAQSCMPPVYPPPYGAPPWGPGWYGYGYR